AVPPVDVPADTAAVPPVDVPADTAAVPPVDVPADTAAVPPVDVPADTAAEPQPPPVVASSGQPILFWVSTNELNQLIGGSGPQNLASLQQAGIGGYAVITGPLGGSIPDWMVSQWSSVTGRGQQ